MWLWSHTTVGQDGVTTIGDESKGLGEGSGEGRKEAKSSNRELHYG